EDISSAAREIQALGAQGGSSGLQTSGSSAQPVRTVAVSTARAAGVTLTRLEPLDDGSLTVWLEDVEAPALYGWLLRLYREHGIAVTKASLSRNSDTPTTRAQIQLSRGSP
ncbi:MAG: type II secretion system protein GspM, partial [Alphaproteobacteria bacterium]|nr:type II secretion system protein GspM [Alphaproteobacteria bacterium]